jgi:F-type H+-transporting ATPase subunit b
MDLNPQPGLTMWTVVTFGLLLAVLSRFVFRPLKGFLEERQRQIEDAVEKARAARTEAQAALARNEEQLRQARDEARKILEEGHRVVATMKREAKDAAKVEAEAVLAHAREEIQSETRHAMDELKETVASLSVRIARQVIKEGLDEERHAALADEFMERLKQAHGHRSP